MEGQITAINYQDQGDTLQSICGVQRWGGLHTWNVIIFYMISITQIRARGRRRSLCLSFSRPCPLLGKTWHRWSDPNRLLLLPFWGPEDLEGWAILFVFVVQPEILDWSWFPWHWWYPLLGRKCWSFVSGHSWPTFASLMVLLATS